MAAQLQAPSSSSSSSSSAPEQIYLRWATRADIPEIARIFHANMLDFPLHDHVAPGRRERPAEFYLWALQRIRMFFCRPAAKFMVAEQLLPHVSGDTSRQILGFALWDAQGGAAANPLAAEWQRAERRQQHPGSSISISSAVWSGARRLERALVDCEGLYHRYFQNTVFDYAAYATIWARLEVAWGGRAALRTNLHLQLLMVDLRWQRGPARIGHRLLQWGLDAAEQFRLPLVIESSLAGYGFYLKHGFTLLTTVAIDVDPAKAFDMPIVVYEPER